MRILGIDPGLRVTGYGVLEVDERSKDFDLKLLEAGIIKTPNKGGIAARLEKIHR